MSPPQPGDLIGDRYEVRRHLGTGGMAQVWLGHDRVLDRSVAIKILSDRYAADPSFVERFRREASSAAGLNHPNIVSVYDRGEADGSYYIVMEHLEGPDLKQVLRDSGPLPAGQAIDLCQQILGALGAAHRRDIVHRDVKPQNVLLSKSGLLKVTDFGIARAGAESDMTQTGSVIGTAQYLSPEQARGDDVTSASDCYSLGIVLYEMLTGQVPFDGDRPVAVAMRQVSETPADPRTLRPDLPPDLAAVVMKALAKRPSDRYRTADEFSRALEAVRPVGPQADEQSTQIMTARTAPTRIQRRAETPAVPVGEPRRRSSAGLIVTLILLAVMLLGLGIFFIGGGLPGGGGNSSVAVPEVAGDPQAIAEAALDAKGLKSEAVENANADVAAGNVVSTRPRAGATVNEGSTVTLVVSAGPPSAPVPDVVGRSIENAQAELIQRDFTVRVQERPDDAPVGEVIDQQPAAETAAPAGSPVTLIVSEGPEEVVVPNVTGDPREDAEDRLRDAGLDPVITEVPTQDTPPDTVIDQSPNGGDTVDRGTEIALTVAVEPEFINVPEVVGLPREEALTRLGDFLPRVVGARNDPTPPQTVIEVLPAAGTPHLSGSTVDLIISRGPGAEPDPDPDDGGLPPEDESTGDEAPPLDPTDEDPTQ